MVQTLLVGAGYVGLEKLQAIYRNSPQAKVRIIAEDISPEVIAFVQGKHQIEIFHRSFHEQDLQGVDLVILATNNSVLNNKVRTMTQKLNILLNVADKPDLCDFYLGSVVQKGNLKIGISTNGKSPTMAKRLKEFLNDILPEELDETLELMQQMRNQLKGDFQEKVRVLNAHTEELILHNKI